MMAEVSASLATRLEVEDFLYREAALLDEWMLDDWLELWADDGEYIIPATDEPSGTEYDSLVLLTDDMFRIRARVIRLNSRRAHREFPYSRRAGSSPMCACSRIAARRSTSPSTSSFTGSETS